jgi:hypothetical protein
VLSNTMLTADAEASRTRVLMSEGAAWRLAAAEARDTGLVEYIRPWSDQSASCAAAPFGPAARISQIRIVPSLVLASPVRVSTATANGPCASKQHQEKTFSAAATGGAMGPLPPRDPV